MPEPISFTLAMLTGKVVGLLGGKAAGGVAAKTVYATALKATAAKATVGKTMAATGKVVVSKSGAPTAGKAAKMLALKLGAGSKTAAAAGQVAKISVPVVWAKPLLGDARNILKAAEAGDTAAMKKHAVRLIKKAAVACATPPTIVPVLEDWLSRGAPEGEALWAVARQVSNLVEKLET